MLRTVFYGALATAAALAGVELWAQRSYRTTVADLRDLLDSDGANASLEDAEAAVKGWVVRPFDREEKSFREDVTIHWRSIIGDYWVRIHATKKSEKLDKQYFTGVVTPDDPAPNIERPSDFRPAPKNGPIGAGVGPGTRAKRKQKKAKQTND